MLLALLLAVAPVASMTAQKKAATDDRQMDRFITSLMKKMTLSEKIGQLNLGAGSDPMVISNSYGLEESARKGLVGASGGADMNLQKIAVEQSRLHIPILFGIDVIHGFATTFPIPLAQASSWNLDLIKRGAQIAAREAASQGFSWTWSPMVDIARDPRWGRVAEGAGEDPFLGSAVARVMVQGYQGSDMGSDSNLVACFKHFGLYGAAEGGRDYNTVDMSRWYMYNFYLPPYKAAVDAGCATGMCSFNVVDGIPASGNKWLLTDLLRDQWGFKGFIVSDANSVGEMEFHHMGDLDEVSRMAITAGMDMDMGSQHYVRALVKLLNEKKISMRDIDTSVRRILEVKYKAGLFDDPYRHLKLQKDASRQAEMLSDAHVDFARRFAAECIVLLKNDACVLPLASPHKVAVIGPIGNDPAQIFGTWSTHPDRRKSHSIAQALQMALPQAEVIQADGCEATEGYGDYYNDSSSVKSEPMIADAVAKSADADVIIACVGEYSGWSGEAQSRVNISLPPCQKKLLKALKATGKKIVVVVFSGRPLVLTDEDRNFSTIVEAWHGGTQAADALADILTGKANPSAKTTMTFPRYQGQIPIYYNHLNTGRPYGEYGELFTCTYKDISFKDNTPLYPFGYGLSYNKYEYGQVRVDKTTARGDGDRIRVSVDITNRGSREGKEVVQLYITDMAGSVSLPVEELKGFQKVDFQPGETRTVSFDVDTSLLKFYNSALQYVWEPGDFKIGIGPNSRDVSMVKVHWDK